MKEKKKLIIITAIVLVMMIATIGIAFAMFMYRETGETSKLVLGDIWMKYTEIEGISLQDALPGDDYSDYFEFTITGTNTYEKEDIWYEIVLLNGEVPEGKEETNRIESKYLKFKLVEVNGNDETVIFTDKVYDDINNKRIHVETIGKTVQDYNKTYRLYMVINEDLEIGNTSTSVMTMEEYENVFASVKVSVTGDFNEKELPIEAVNFVSAVKSKYGTDSTLVAVNTNGDLYEGTGEIREYRYSGPTANNYVFFDTNGDEVKTDDEVWRIIGVFEDTVKDEEGEVVLDSLGNSTYEEKVKLVRNTALTAEELPESYLIEGTTYTIASSATSSAAYLNKKASGTNNNDWTTAGLQYYLNTEIDETDTSDGITTANVGYLSLLSTEAKEQISPTTYYLGNVAYNTSTKIVYADERDNTKKWSYNQSVWDGLVGLMYPSDYGYSANSDYWMGPDLYSYDAEAYNTSWMMKKFGHNSDTEWLLSPSVNFQDTILDWRDTGYVYDNSAVDFECYNVRPTFYLKSNTKILDAEGTELDPYVVVLD